MNMKGGMLLVFVLFLIFIPLVQADVISVNSGGTGNVILNPDEYIEGFFFGGSQYCGDGVIQSPNDYGIVEECDDGNTVSGDGCSATCQIEDTGDDDGDAGGGGGGEITPTENISLDPTEFNIKLTINTNEERIVSVTNLGSSEVTLPITQQNLDNRVILGTNNITLQPGETKTFSVIFVASSETGIFTGRIFVGGNEILVSLNVQSGLLLFDSNIVVLNPDYQVEQGDDLRTLVTLIPFGDNVRLDVTLDFTIRDYAGNIYLTKSESILVTEMVDVRRNFDTGSLPIDDYIIGLELIYPNGVAPSSAHFEVTEREGIGLFGLIVIILILLILMILIIIISIQIKRRLDERKQQTGSYF